MLFLLLLAFASSVASDIMRYLQNEVSSILLIAVRLTLAGTVLLTYQYVFNRQNFRLVNKDPWQHAKIILLGFFAPLVLLSLAINYLPPFDDAVFAAPEPLIIYTLTFLVFNEKISWRKTILLFVSLSVLFTTIFIDATIEQISLASIHAPKLLVAALCSGYFWLIVERHMKKFNEDAVMLTGVGSLFAGLLAFVAAFFFDKNLQMTGNVWELSLLGVMVLLGDIYVFRTRISLTKKYTGTFISLINLLVPFNVAINQLLRGDKIPWYYFLGLIPAVLCIYIFYREETKPATPSL